MRFLAFLLLLAAPLAAQPRLLAPIQGFSFPVFLTHAPGQPDYLYIVEKGGTLRSYHRPTGAVATIHTFGGLTTSGERGFLGLAFHPDFATNGHAYCYTSVPKSGVGINHESLLRRLTFTSATTADPASDTPVLRFDQPYGNHNGGWIGFGPDGFLYIATGDGGDRDGPDDHSQDHNSLLGKLLRIDVNGDDFPGDPNRNYAIPVSNPFAPAAGLVAQEIWSYGLRNPWRCAFDRITHDLYIADVGQDYREEVNFQPASSIGGEHYGWRLREGLIATPTGGVGGPKPDGAIDPVYDYTHGSGDSQGYSLTGGYPYRGPSPSLQGKYFFADYATNRVWSLEIDQSTNPAIMAAGSFTDWTDTLNATISGSLSNPTSFGEDSDGNLYIIGRFGDIHPLVAEPRSPRIRAVSLADTTVTLHIDHLTPGTTNSLQRTTTPDLPDSWSDVASFSTLAGTTTLTDAPSPVSTSLYYRVLSVITP